MRAVRLSALALVFLATQGAAPGAEPPIGTSSDSRVRTALKEQAYPWYDRENDRVKPVLPDPSSWMGGLQRRFDAFLDWLDRVFGRQTSGEPQASGRGKRGFLATFLLMVAGGFLLIMLWRSWRTYTPDASSAPGQTVRIGDAARIAGLAPGVSLEGMDPWAEAERRRKAGDAAGAVIWLFLDQLMGLQRAGLIRLIPGRTARQYAGGLSDTILRDGLRTTLTVFEEVYYGHRLPGPEELDRLWSRAEIFRRRLQTIQVE